MFHNLSWVNPSIVACEFTQFDCNTKSALSKRQPCPSLARQAGLSEIRCALVVFFFLITVSLLVLIYSLLSHTHPPSVSFLSLIHMYIQAQEHTYTQAFATYQTQVVQSCMMGVVWCSCLLVQCSRELELFKGTRQRSAGRPLCSTPQQHSTRRNSFLMSLLRSV